MTSLVSKATWAWSWGEGWKRINPERKWNSLLSFLWTSTVRRSWNAEPHGESGFHCSVFIRVINDDDDDDVCVPQLCCSGRNLWPPSRRLHLYCKLISVFTYFDEISVVRQWEWIIQPDVETHICIRVTLGSGYFRRVKNKTKPPVNSSG